MEVIPVSWTHFPSVSVPSTALLCGTQLLVPLLLPFLYMYDTLFNQNQNQNPNSISFLRILFLPSNFLFLYFVWKTEEPLSLSLYIYIARQF